MNMLHIITHGDGAFSNLNKENVVHLKNHFSIARLPHGMESGRSSVAIKIDLPDGRTVIQELSMANFLACARIFNRIEDESNCEDNQ